MPLTSTITQPLPTGLTQAEAARRLAADGPNELPTTRPRSSLAIAWTVAREPMFLLLVACGAIYLALGDAREALMLLGFVFFVMGLTLLQERKSERALEALRDLSSPRALVIRDGQERRIPGRDVVRGDVIVLVEGDRVAADAILDTGLSLSVDESLLTGESVPVRKRPARPSDPERGRPGGDDLPHVYSGTLVVAGRATAHVVATGPATELGRIGKALACVTAEPTRIQREVGRVVKIVAMLGSLVALTVAIAYGAMHASWLQGMLVGITVAMSLLPEELPVVLTTFLAIGAWRLGRKNVLTRRIPAVETLGAATVLCVDKTGTLTQNRMQLAALSVDGAASDVAGLGSAPLPEEYHAVLEYAVLASHRDPFDPTERAIRDAGAHLLAGTEHLHGDWALVDEYPLSSELLAMSRVWRSPDRAQYAIAAKGAPEAIADLCHLPATEVGHLEARVDELARRGLRVLGVAKAEFADADLPPAQHDFAFEFVGLIGLADPVRATVPAAIEECRQAGVRVVMITGDYPATALSIARQIGLDHGAQLMTGPELDALNDTELTQRIEGADIFCRVVPEQKLRLVEALKAHGEIVAMTGDGVNDAPALRAAHIGVAMGGRGTDVARESADLVLLDDDFSSIVEAVKLGRRIFDNLKKAIAFIVAAHVPIAGLSLIPVLVGWPLILMPAHILFLELIIDPACSLVFEAEREERDVMRRPPRRRDASLFDRRVLWAGALQGLVVLAVGLAIFGLTLHLRRGAGEARALTFTTLIVASLGLIVANRSWSRSMLEMLRRPNRALWIVAAGAIAFLALVLEVPLMREAFRLAPLHAVDLALCAAAGLGCTVVFAAINWLGLRPTAGRPIEV